MGMSSMLENKIDRPATATQSFRSGSGEVVTLDEQQIDRIPYVAALVSSADWFVGARDDEGHFKLDPNIQLKYFSAALPASTSDSLYHLLIHLPTDYDIIPVIAHLDFLGLIDGRDPTLDEVDDTFFCTLVYDIRLRTYSQRIRLYNFQHMAVRFTIALARDEYDFSDDAVIDRIYWYVMFIISARSVFPARLRQNVYRVARLCFRLFKPSMVRPLENLRIRTEHEVDEPPPPTNGTDTYDDEQSVRVLEQLIDTHMPATSRRSRRFNDWFLGRWLHRFPIADEYVKDDLFPSENRSEEEELLEPLVAAVSQMAYERLQQTVARRATKKCLLSIPVVGEEGFDSGAHRFLLSFIDWRPPLVWLTSTDEERVKKELLRELFENEAVKGEIDNLISAAVSIMIQKLERRHLQLVKKIQNHAPVSQESNDWLENIYLWNFDSDIENLQLDALAHELLLDRLRQRTIIVEELHERVLKRLYGAAVKQIIEWASHQNTVERLCKSLSKPSKKDPLALIEIPKFHRSRKEKSLPKKQLKHSKRWFDSVHSSCPLTRAGSIVPDFDKTEVSLVVVQNLF